MRTWGKRGTTLGSAIILFGLLALPAWSQSQRMLVQVKESPLRSSPSFLSTPTATVGYGDRVQVVETRGAWRRVRIVGHTGWLHESALTTRRMVLRAGGEEAEAAATSEELALAGRGFNRDVERAYRQEERLDYHWVDRMEKMRVSEQDKIRFLEEGGLRVP